MAGDLSSIDHIVVVMLENRSFDHMLGYLSLPGGLHSAPGAMEGLRTDPAWVAKFTNMSDGAPFAPKRIVPGATPLAEPKHSYDNILRQVGLKAGEPGPAPMLGFADNYAQPNKPGKPKNPPGLAMGYYDQESVPVFDFFARHFAICDHWHAPLPCATQPNRLAALSGFSKRVNNHKKPLPDQPLVYEWFGKPADKKVSWCVYQSGWFPFFFIMAKWIPRILESLAGSHTGDFRRIKHFDEQWKGPGAMPSVIFIEPRYREGPGKAADDDHPAASPAAAQRFLARIYQTLIARPDRWARTMMIVTYDEHGGFFDHVTPLAISDTAGAVPVAITGARVPALIVSPLVEPGSVFHEPLDHTSILQLLAEKFRPGEDYSPRVKARHAQGKLGKLSNILRPPPPVATIHQIPDAVLAALGLTADAEPRPQIKGTSAEDPATAQALHLALLKAKDEHGDLMVGADWAEANTYLAANPDPPA